MLGREGRERVVLGLIDQWKKRSMRYQSMRETHGHVTMRDQAILVAVMARDA